MGGEALVGKPEGKKDLEDLGIEGSIVLKYKVIHKSLRDFRTRLRNNHDRHGRKEHINR